MLAGREIELDPGDHVLGRGSEADVLLDRARASRRHARIRVAANHATLEDLGSKNGTFHRGRRLDGPVPLADGDEIRIGSERLVFRAIERDVATETDVDDRAGE